MRDSLSAADKLHHDIDIRRARQRTRIVFPARMAKLDAARLRAVTRAHGDKFDGAPGGGSQKFPPRGKNFDNAGPDGAKARHAYPKWLAHVRPVLLTLG
jgi:hypothetical protein